MGIFCTNWFPDRKEEEDILIYIHRPASQSIKTEYCVSSISVSSFHAHKAPFCAVLNFINIQSPTRSQCTVQQELNLIIDLGCFSASFPA